MRKRLLCIGLSLFMTLELVTPVAAVTSAGVRQQQEQTKNNLAGLETEIDQMETEKQEVSEELITLQNQLVDILTSIRICEAEIDAKKLAIDDARDDMMVAKQLEEMQFVDMKKRVKFLYEQGDKKYLQILFGSGNFSEMVNKADYVEKVLEYDRKLLANYVASRQEVAELRDKLETEEAELEAANYELEQEQGALETIVEEKKETVENFEAELAAAAEKAQQYKDQLVAQTTQIKELEVQEAAARRRQAQEAARKRQEAARKKREEASKPKVDDDTEAILSADASDPDTPENMETSADYVEPETENYDDSYAYDDSSYYYNDVPDYSYYDDDDDDDDTVETTSDGKKVIAYACKFVGNPYKFGGTSLTHGVDCSGFTQAVYAHFGISIPRDSTSQRSCGRAVDYKDAQPGDLICYAGHVALYIGNGQIVHASSERTGITYCYATYRTILAVRRVL